MTVAGFDLDAERINRVRDGRPDPGDDDG
jgi:hypothetical protein